MFAQPASSHRSVEPAPGSPVPASSSYTVLRIKRKATDAPLSSLVIQDLEPRLRPKRRRDVSGRPRGVFRLAETVPETWKGRGEEGEVLKSRIQDLLSSPQNSSTQLDLKSPTSALPTLAPQADVSQAAPPTSSPPSTQTPAAAPPESKSPPAAGPSQTQYRVVPPLSPRTRMMMPPRLITTAESENPDPGFVFVDAQAVSPSAPVRGGSVSGQDKEMDAFLPMLEEYLKFEETQKKPLRPVPPEVGEDEWVYDLYYRDNRGSAPLGLGVGDGVSIGQLLGFEDISPPSSISGSEPEDEADEDSNDEDYYRNDYPEDEDADEDMEGFRVANDGFGGGEDDDEWSEDEGYSDGDDRGEWGYR